MPTRARRSLFGPSVPLAPSERVKSVLVLAAAVGLVVAGVSLPSCKSFAPITGEPARPAGGAPTPNAGGKAGSSAGTPAGSTTTAAGAALPAAVTRGSIAGIFSEPDLRIRLAQSMSEVTLGSPTGRLWFASGNLNAPAIASGAASTPAGTGARSLVAPLRVRLTDAGWELLGPAGERTMLPATASAEFAAEEGLIGSGLSESAVRGNTSAAPTGRSGGLARTPSGMVIVNGKRYAGVIRLIARAGGGGAAAAAGLTATPSMAVAAPAVIGSGAAPVAPQATGRTFDLVEHVGIEDYLRGVVSSEMFPNWPVEAYKAQAVAARTYALQTRALVRGNAASGSNGRTARPNQAFDVESTIRDQAYGGTADRPAIVQAVDQTAGVVLTWNGQFLRAYYHSTCGGRAASARDTWPTGAGFEYNLSGPIQAQSRDFACNSASMFRWSVSRTRAETVARLRQWGFDAGHPVKAITGLERILPLAEAVTGRPSRFMVVQPGGQTFQLSAEELRLAFNEDVAGQATIAPNAARPPAVGQVARVPSGDLEVTLAGEVVTITGRGFGHGVGMCQWCAKGFADRGENFATMLQRFYPAARLERVY